jgi:PmbA protein
MDFKTIGETIISKAKKYGADEAEAYFENVREFGVEIRNGAVETLQKSESNGLGLRVFVNRQLGFCSTSDLTPASLDETVRKTVDLAKITGSRPWNGLPDFELGTPKDLDLYDPGIASVPDETKMKMARDLEKAALGLDKRITNSSGSSFSNTEKTVGIFNSKGMGYLYKETSFSVGVSVIAGEKNSMQSGGWSSSKRFFKELAPLEEIAATAVKKAVEKLNPKPVKTANVPVVFDRYAAGSFWRGLGFALGGDSAYRKTTFLCDLLDKPIASPLITAVDDPTIPRFVGSMPFDGEGNLTRRNVIIDKGVLKLFFYESMTARKTGVRAHTTARRYGYQTSPYASALCVIVENGREPFEALLKDIKQGLYVTGLRGLGTNATTGSYSVGGSGFWIENGAVAYPVDGVTLGGTTLEILKNIDMLANDLDMRGPLNSPSFRVSSMTVGGR